MRNIETETEAAFDITAYITAKANWGQGEQERFRAAMKADILEQFKTQLDDIPDEDCTNLRLGGGFYIGINRLIRKKNDGFSRISFKKVLESVIAGENAKDIYFIKVMELERDSAKLLVSLSRSEGEKFGIYVNVEEEKTETV